MKKLLVVVDFQVDFVSGALGFAGAENLEEPICKKIAQYRRAGAQIAFTFDTHNVDYLSTQEGKRLPVPHCLHGSDGWQLFGRIDACREPQDHCIEKPVFGSEALAQFAKEQGFAQIELCGLVSYICVLSNAILLKAALPEAEILVDSRCTAGPDAKLHQAALDLLASVQVTVI